MWNVKDILAENRKLCLVFTLCLNICFGLLRGKIGTAALQLFEESDGILQVVDCARKKFFGHTGQGCAAFSVNLQSS